MAFAKGACLNHISRESSDIRRLANFYKDIFGLEEIESPKFEFKVIWLKISPDLAFHLIERSPDTKLPEGPYSASSPVLDPTHLPRGHHVCFSVSNFDSFVQSLKVSQSFFFVYFLYSCLICLCLFQKQRPLSPMSGIYFHLTIISLLRSTRLKYFLIIMIFYLSHNLKITSCK